MSEVVLNPSFWRKLNGLLRHRCPRCLTGRIFKSQFRMNDPCLDCGLIFQREEGYFLGSMFASYLLGCLFFGIAFLLAVWLLPDWNTYWLLAAAIIPYVLLTPVVFRYSRTIWIYFERWTCPGDVSATPYEKTRAREIERRAAGVDNSPS